MGRTRLCVPIFRPDVLLWELRGPAGSAHGLACTNSDPAARVPEDVGLADLRGRHVAYDLLRLSRWGFSFVSYMYSMISCTWLPLCVVTTCRPRLSLSVPFLIGTCIGDLG